MANSEDEVVVDFGNVSPWLLPNRLDKLLAQKVAAASNTPSDTAIPSDNGVTTDTTDPFYLNS